MLVAASVQLSLAASAWADLATRTADEVNGGRLRWAAVIAVNFFGPLAWFRWGRLPRSAPPRPRTGRQGVRRSRNQR